MNNQMSGLGLVVPLNWTDAIIRSVIVAVVGFFILQIKEYIDAGTFDTIGTATDALLISGGYFFVNAGFMAFAKPAVRQHRANQ
jgi:hypothetical protein